MAEKHTQRNLEIVARHQLAMAEKEKLRKEAPGEQSSSLMKKLAVVGLPIFFLLSKLKWLGVILKLTKMSTLITMFIAIWVYAQLWGAYFAIGFVVLIFIHEMGHGLVMHRLGIKAGAPIFIPFVGAIIAMKEMPRDAYKESLIAAGGPALGTIGAALCFLLAWQMNSELFYALASVGFMLNLFNMLPISPLDGGRMLSVVSRNIGIIGLGLGGFVFWHLQSPILLIILLFGVFSLFSTQKMPEGYYNVPKEQKQLMGVLYFLMIFIMVAGMWFSDQQIRHLVQTSGI